MRSAHIDEILIPPNRQRREFDPEKISALASSIQSKGLLHAPVLRQSEAGLELVAGERRLRAISQLYMTGGSVICDGEVFAESLVPYTLLSDLSPLAIREAELEENIIRVDLTWQERAAATKELHDLRGAQKAARGERQSVADTTEEVSGGRSGRAYTGVKVDLIVAQHLDKPEVAKASSAKEAFKALTRLEVGRKNADLAALIGETFSAADHALHQADAREWLAVQPGDQFDVILSDPPYGMGADEFNDAGGSLSSMDHAYKDDYDGWLALMSAVMSELFRLAKQQAHLYLFCDIDRFHELRTLAAAAGWRVHRTPIIWTKPAAHRVPWPNMGPRRQWEMCLYAVKGDKPVNMIAADVVSAAADTNLGHAAQKPVVLFAELLRRSVVAGNRVLDFCCGTGTIFAAAQQFKVSATGVESSAATFGIAAKRLEALGGGK